MMCDHLIAAATIVSTEPPFVDVYPPKIIEDKGHIACKAFEAHLWFLIISLIPFRFKQTLTGVQLEVLKMTIRIRETEIKPQAFIWLVILFSISSSSSPSSSPVFFFYLSPV